MSERSDRSGLGEPDGRCADGAELGDPTGVVLSIAMRCGQRLVGELLEVGHGLDLTGQGQLGGDEGDVQLPDVVGRRWARVALRGGPDQRGRNKIIKVDQTRCVVAGARTPRVARRSSANRVPITVAARTRMTFPEAAVTATYATVDQSAG